MNIVYYDFGNFLKKYFNCKIQKISINAGFTCPNRDGTKGYGGCTYCNNRTFNPEYCKPVKNISTQLEEGKRFFARKYPEMKYIAYFQAYTNTYADLFSLRKMYEEALCIKDVEGIIIGTRPDCMPDELLDYLSILSKRKFVLVEYGAETSDDKTLKIINRGHTWEDTVDAVNRTHARGIICGLHLIMGLPGETEETMLKTIDDVSRLPVSTVKIHQLQLIRGTRLAQQVETGELSVAKWTAEQYITLCLRVIERINPSIAIERFVSQSPDNLLISPRWGLKNYEFTDKLKAKAAENHVKQGIKFKQF